MRQGEGRGIRAVVAGIGRRRTVHCGKSNCKGKALAPVSRLRNVLVYIELIGLRVGRPDAVELADRLAAEEAVQVRDAGIHGIVRRRGRGAGRPAQELIAHALPAGQGLGLGVVHRVILLLRAAAGAVAVFVVVEHQGAVRLFRGEIDGDAGLMLLQRVGKREVRSVLRGRALPLLTVQLAAQMQNHAGTQAVCSADGDVLERAVGDGKMQRLPLLHGDGVQILQRRPVIDALLDVHHRQGAAVGAAEPEGNGTALYAVRRILRGVDDVQIDHRLPHGIDGLVFLTRQTDDGVGGNVRDIFVHPGVRVLVEADQQIAGVIAEDAAAAPLPVPCGRGGIVRQMDRGIALHILETDLVCLLIQDPGPGPAPCRKRVFGVLVLQGGAGKVGLVGVQGELCHLRAAVGVGDLLIHRLHVDDVKLIGIVGVDGKGIAGIIVYILLHRRIDQTPVDGAGKHQPPAAEDVGFALHGKPVDRQLRGLAIDRGGRAVGVGAALNGGIAPMQDVSVDQRAVGGHGVFRDIPNDVAAVQPPHGPELDRPGHHVREIIRHDGKAAVVHHPVPAHQDIVLSSVGLAVFLEIPGGVLGKELVLPGGDTQRFALLYLRAVIIIIGIDLALGDVDGVARVGGQLGSVEILIVYIVEHIVRAEGRRLHVRDLHVFPRDVGVLGDGLLIHGVEVGRRAGVVVDPVIAEGTGETVVDVVDHAAVGVHLDAEFHRRPLGVEHLVGGGHGAVEVEVVPLVHLIVVLPDAVLIPAGKHIVVRGCGDEVVRAALAVAGEVLLIENADRAVRAGAVGILHAGQVGIVDVEGEIVGVAGVVNVQRISGACAVPRR